MVRSYIPATTHGTDIKRGAEAPIATSATPDVFFADGSVVFLVTISLRLHTFV